MTDEARPSFFSWRFHARFFPGVLWRRVTLRPPFPSAHVRWEPIIALVAACAAIGFAAPSATRGSGFAIVIAALGAVALAALVIQSVWSARSIPFRYDAFAVAPMAACIVLGADLGLAAGRGIDVTTPARIAYAAAGALVGYFVGIGAGFLTQKLGWIAGFFSLVCALSTIGLILLAFVLLV